MFLALKNQNKFRKVKREQGHSTFERLKQLHLPFLNEKQFFSDSSISQRMAAEGALHQDGR